MNNAQPILRGRRRYDWWRARHGLPHHGKWRSVARMANVPLSVAFHIAVCLLDLASRSSPRGSIGDFKPFDIAGAVDVPVDDVDRVVKALRDIHWIEGHMLAQWDDNQPQREDPDAAIRKRKWRERTATPLSHNVTQGHAEQNANVTHSHAVSRDVTQQPPEMSHDVTHGHAPDIDKNITSTFSVAAREELSPARGLASAPDAGALARSPPAKSPHQVSREELDEMIRRKHDAGTPPLPQQTLPAK